MKLHPESSAPAIDQSTGKTVGTNQPSSVPDITQDDGSGNVAKLITALNQVASHVSMLQPPLLTTFVEPGFSKDWEKSVIKSAQAELAAYADQFFPVKNFYIIMASTPGFALKSYGEIEMLTGHPGIVNGAQGGLRGSEDPNDPSKFRSTQFPMAITSGYGPVDFAVVGLYQSPDFIWPGTDSVGPGEIKHALFYSITKGYQLAPCLMTPGFLGLFGTAFTTPSSTPTQMLTNFVKDGANFNSVSNTPLYQTLDLSTLDSGPPIPGSGSECSVTGDYRITPVAAAYLVAMYGLDKEFSYLKLFGENPNAWRQEFLTTFGLPIEKFESDAHDFLVWYKEWSKKYS